MKRRKTKKVIRTVERRLANQVRAYFASLAEGNDRATEHYGCTICINLTRLLSQHLELNSSWPYRERWLDGITDGNIHVSHADTLYIYGKMTWGLIRDIGGNQWDEPFEAVVKISKNRQRIISYTLNFGSDEPLSNKLVEPGFYSILASEPGAERFCGPYGHQFSG